MVLIFFGMSYFSYVKELSTSSVSKTIVMRVSVFFEQKRGQATFTKFGQQTSTAWRRTVASRNCD